MKIVAGIVMFVLLGAVAQGQEAKIVAEIAASGDKLVKNSPFSAEAVSESVQTLSDGNRIVRSSTSKLYRNSEGRFRREMNGGSGGVLGSLYTVGQGVTILDPVGGFRYSIDPNMRTTRQMIYTPHADIKVITAVGEKMKAELKATGVAQVQAPIGRELAEKIRAEVTTTVAAAPVAAVGAVTGQVMEGLAPLAMPGVATTIGGHAQHMKWETRTENLGSQNIEGVDAEGTRTVTTIPTGAIGNERPIEIVYEKWFSRDLQLVVQSKHSDPRFGEQTYRLTNINRSEPDPSLFTPPNGYRLFTEPSRSYTYSTAVKAAMAAEKAASGKSATTAVSKTKP